MQPTFYKHLRLCAQNPTEAALLWVLNPSKGMKSVPIRSLFNKFWNHSLSSPGFREITGEEVNHSKLKTSNWSKQLMLTRRCCSGMMEYSTTTSPSEDRILPYFFLMKALYITKFVLLFLSLHLYYNSLFSFCWLMWLGALGGFTPNLLTAPEEMSS